MADSINSVSSVDGDNSSVMDQWLAMQENDQSNSMSETSTGSLYYQLEMHSAMNSIMSSTSEIQKQQKENAEESGNEQPVTSF